jgi:hypothetical protein
LEVQGLKLDELRERVNRLHAERGEAVRTARQLRQQGGVVGLAFQTEWARVEELTESIEIAERALAEAEATANDANGANGEPTRGRYAKRRAAWHDHAAGDWPDGDIAVVALVRYPDVDGPVIKRVYHNGTNWKSDDTDSYLRGSVIGWMTDDEALSLLGKAVRHG